MDVGDARQRKVKHTLFYLIVISFVIVSTSLFVYHIINRHIVMDRSPTDAILRMLPFYEVETIRGINAAVLRSEQTAQYMARQAGGSRTPEQIKESYYEIAEFWHSFLQNEKNFDTDIITDQDLTERLYQYNLLIVPMAHCLSDQQIDAVKSFLNQQRGVIFTHLSGNRDEEGNERDWSLTADITGSRLSFHPLGGDPVPVNLFANNPVSANISPGFALKVHPYDELIMLEVKEKRVQPAGAWNISGFSYDYDIHTESGIVYGEYLGGRFVSLGFTPASVKPEAKMWDALYKVLDNATNWVGRRTVIGKAPWPQTEAAANFAVYAERDINRTVNLIRILQEKEVNPTLFVEQDAAAINRIMFDEFSDSVNFAARLNLRPSLVEEGMNSDVQGRISTTQNRIDEAINAKVKGFNFPLIPDWDVEPFLPLEAHFIWIDGENGFAPVLMHPRRQPLFRRRIIPPVFIPQSAYVDKSLMARMLDNPDMALEMLTMGVDNVIKTGGLYSATLHADLLDDQRHRNLIESWIGHFDRKKVWMASPSEIADWWRRYENIKISHQEDVNRIVLMISNEGIEQVPHIRIQLYPGRMPSGDEISIESERIRTPIPSYNIDRDNEMIELNIEDMRRREHRTYYIEY